MWLLKIKSIATGEYQTIEKNADLTALSKEGDRLVAKGIKIQIIAEKKEPSRCNLHNGSIENHSI